MIFKVVFHWRVCSIDGRLHLKRFKSFKILIWFIWGHSSLVLLRIKQKSELKCWFPFRNTIPWMKQHQLLFRFKLKGILFLGWFLGTVLPLYTKILWVCPYVLKKSCRGCIAYCLLLSCGDFGVKPYPT